jgi:hypothetical protein
VGIEAEASRELALVRGVHKEPAKEAIMRKYIIAFALFAGMGTGFSIGCGKDGGGQSAQSYKDDTCKCKDKACLEDVEKKYENWKFAQLEKAMKSGKPSEKSEKEMDLDAERMKCRMDIEFGDK